MKKFKNWVSVLTICVLGALVVASCTKDEPSTHDKLTKGLPSSGGKTLEMLVVCSDEVYRGNLRDSIGENFEKAQNGLNQKEPLFDVVHLVPERFIHSDMLQKHRNILIIDYKKGNANKIYQEINKRVFPQAVYKVVVDNRDSLFSILTRFYPTIRIQFYKNEHVRIFNIFKRNENLKLDKKIRENFSFSMTLSSDFYLAKETEDFFWIRKETENESYNITIYKAPFTGNGLYAKDKILDIRDINAKKYIPGSVKNSYMGTEIRENLAPIYMDTVVVNGIAMVETRGLWRLFNDYMGGPFINYVFQNPKTKEYIMIDCFLYSPKKPKRDLLIQLESAVYGINKEIK